MPLDWKYFSLVALSVQNAMFAISIRYSRIRKGNIFISSTAVLNTEIAKLLLSLALVYMTEHERSLTDVIYTQIFGQPWDTLKVCIPGLVYVIQNNLQYFAATHLDAATFQVTYQLKILTTAMFSLLMLPNAKKKIGRYQWFALVILLVGVVLAQLTDTTEGMEYANTTHQNRIIGICAACLASCCSGFAGVYFELLLNGPKSPSVWVRNVQLSLFSIPISLFTCLLKDWEFIETNGYFFGYDAFVFYLISLQTFGGLLVGLVVKSNLGNNGTVLKGFATAFAIVLACLASMFVFDLQITFQFLIGTTAIIISIFLYGHGRPLELRLRTSSVITDQFQFSSVIYQFSSRGKLN